MAYQKLGRSSAPRRALLRALVTALLSKEKIETTEGKGKAVKSIVDKMITLGKEGSLHSRRQAAAYLMDEDVLTKLFDTIGPRYKDRQGGYARVFKTGVRRGDSAPVVIVQLI